MQLWSKGFFPPIPPVLFNIKGGEQKGGKKNTAVLAMGKLEINT